MPLQIQTYGSSEGSSVFNHAVHTASHKGINTPYSHTYGRRNMFAGTTREGRGEAIAKTDGQVRRIDDHSYKVASQSGNGFYDVTSAGIGWACSCPDFAFRANKCKHVWAVELSHAIRREVQESQENIVLSPVTEIVCGFCSSENVIRKSVRHNQHGDLQRYLCKECGRRFSFNLGFEKMHATPQAITGAMQLYFTGESLRNVQKFLGLQGVSVSHVAVFKWIRKYVGLMEKYLDRITPKVSDTWRADEILVKFRGNMKYVFALMDDETRFWIAHEVADSKFIHDARTLLRNGKELAGKRPLTLVTDGMLGYSEAFKKEYRTLTGPRSQHVRNITFDGNHNNNKMERMNGEIRDREKIMRGLKKPDTPILPGYRIYHNYLRPHEGLKGRTPAQAAGITIEGENKWLTLIQNAASSRREVKN